MAPEQFAGKSASVRSDLYSLGLVLYELSTGKRAFDAVTIAGYRKKHSEETPTKPSVVLPDFDPAVERVILRCIEKDPAQRPSSAAQVAAALPGGDPLAAALAAGETPSPEMVAAAGQRGGIAPAQARWLLLGLAVALAAAIFLTPRANIAWFVGLDKSPAVLRERAREILQLAGLTTKPVDFAESFETNWDFLSWEAAHGGFQKGMGRDAVAFSYRQSQSALFPQAISGPEPGPRVTNLDPAPVEVGMGEVAVDPRGQLIRLQVVTPEQETEAGGTPETDWGSLFRAAGLDMNRFTPVEPRWTPRSFALVRAAWEGPHPELPGVTMRVEAASYRGRPVSFLWLGPWSRPSREAPEVRSGFAVWSYMLIVLLLGGAWLARNNLRAGRGDRKGAMRLAAVAFVVEAAMWALGSHHSGGLTEAWNLIGGFSNCAAMAVGLWIIYIALEPFARRRWPEMLISWTRALSGQWRDPLVGRDLLIGTVAGTAVGLVLGPIRVLLPPLLHLPARAPHPFAEEAPSSPMNAVAWMLSTLVGATIWILAIVFFLVLVRIVVRRGWIAGFVVVLIFTASFLGDQPAVVTLPLALLSIGVIIGVTIRYGVLAGIVAEVCRHLSGYGVYTTDPSSWYFYASVIAVAVLLGLAFWATKTALAGHPLFGGLALEEKAAQE